MTQRDILLFLKENQDDAFRSKDIAQHIKVNRTTAGTSLNKLKRGGFIKKYYKIVKKKNIPYYKYVNKEVKK